MTTEAVTPEAVTEPAPILLSERQGGLLVLTMNRPERLNALSPELHDELDHALEAASRDVEVKAVVLTGSGRAFCSGGDLSGDRNRPRPKGLEGRADHAFHNAIASRLLHDMPKPTIALMNGPTAGAGLALALSCDLRLTIMDAVFTTDPLPCFSITGSTWRRPRNTPRTFTAITASNTSSSYSAVGASFPSIPALLWK